MATKNAAKKKAPSHTHRNRSNYAVAKGAKVTPDAEDVAHRRGFTIYLTGPEKEALHRAAREAGFSSMSAFVVTNALAKARELAAQSEGL